MEPAQQSAAPSTNATSAVEDIDMDDGTATEAGDMMVRRGGSHGDQNLWALLCICRCGFSGKSPSRCKCF